MSLLLTSMYVSQLSGGTPSHPHTHTDHSSQLATMEAQVDRLHGDVRQLTLERDQAYSDLSALRASLIEEHDSQAKKVMIDVPKAISPCCKGIFADLRPFLKLSII